MNVQRYVAVAVAMLVGVMVTLTHCYCCNPDQYESRGAGVMQEVKADKQTIEQLTLSTSYDYTNKRMVASFNVSINDNTQYDAKLLIVKSTLYIIDIIKQACLKEPAGQFKRTCVPDDATEIGIINMGIESTSFLATSYSFVDVANGPATLSVTNAKCTFVTETACAFAQGRYSMSAVEYFNTTLGIKDPSVFDVPSYCTKSTANVESLIKGEPEHGGAYSPLGLFKLLIQKPL